MIRLAAALLATAVPAVAWHLAAAADRLAAGLAPAPFGWPRLLVAHLVAALPLAYCVALRFGSRGTPFVRLLVAVGVTLATALALPGFAAGLADAGALERALARSLLAALAVTPWLAVGVRTTATVRLPWIAAVAFLVVPPLVYAQRLDETRAADFETFAKSGRLVRALATLDGLADLGSTRRFAGKSVRELLPLLRKDVARLEALVAAPLPPDAPDRARLSRAMLLVRLNRHDAAEEVLKGIASPSSEVWMVRAAIARERSRWADLESACSEAIERAVDSSALLEDAFDGLAEAQRQLGRPDDAAATYRAAARRLPHRAGYCELQLGLLEADRGRSEAALAHFAEAVRLDPSLEVTVAPHRRRVRTNSPSCLAQARAQ